MSGNIDLILCSRPPFCCYSKDRGMLVGARSDHSQQLSCCKPDFLDFNFHKPNFRKHLDIVKRFQPKYAIAPDLYTQEQLPEVLEQAEQLAKHAEQVIIVPKFSGAIRQMPKQYIIALSVPSKYGDCGNILMAEFFGRKVHLLGGSPHYQYKLWRHLPGADIISIDGNAYMLSANFGDFWDADKCGWNRTLRGKSIDRGELIKMSVDNVIRFWGKRLTR